MRAAGMPVRSKEGSGRLVMRYAVDKQELRAWARTGPFVPTFTGAEMLLVAFRTDPAVIAEVLPKPLEVPADPIAMAFVARYPETNFGLTYNEGALMVPAAFKGEAGGYCLAMPVDDDMAMVGGRERHGFPKKLADEITLHRDRGYATGSVVRRGEEILHIEADLTDTVDIGALSGVGLEPVADLDGAQAVPFVSYLFKHFPATDGNGFEYAPRLIRQVTLFRPREGLQSGAGKIAMAPAPADPLGDIPVFDVVSTLYGVFDNVMLPGRVMAKVRNPLQFAPYAFFSTDTLAIVDPSTRPALSRRRRRQLRKQAARY
jgi:acetoacetate decarboxylase